MHSDVIIHGSMHVALCSPKSRGFSATFLSDAIRYVASFLGEYYEIVLKDFEVCLIKKIHSGTE